MISGPGNASASRIVFPILILPCTAIVADQLAAPALRTSSPLWATFCLLALIWRRSQIAPFPPVTTLGARLAAWRLAVFAILHLTLVFAARAWLQESQGAMDPAGHPAWPLTALKFTVLLPTAVLLPLPAWRILARVYCPEFSAAFIVLFTYLPSRIMDTLWPWYGRFLGRLVFSLSWPFAHSLGYVKAWFPTITGPGLDVTIALACSGFDGIKLFDYLFGFVALCDWNRLNKGRTLTAYFAGVGVMLLGNALRIVFMVVLGNRGFDDFVARFHLSAGWMFFSAVFLLYLSAVYRWMLIRRPQ